MFGYDAFEFDPIDDCICGAGLSRIHDIGCPSTMTSSASRESREYARTVRRNAGSYGLAPSSRPAPGAPSAVRGERGGEPGGTLIRSQVFHAQARQRAHVEWQSQIPANGPYLLDIEFEGLSAATPDREHLLASLSVENFLLGNECFFGTSGPFPARQVFGTAYRGGAYRMGHMFRVQLQAGEYDFSAYLVVKTGQLSAAPMPPLRSSPPLPPYDPAAFRPERMVIPSDIAFDRSYDFILKDIPAPPMLSPAPVASPPVDPKRLEHEHRVSLDRCHTLAYLERVIEDPFADIDPDDP